MARSVASPGEVRHPGSGGIGMSPLATRTPDDIAVRHLGIISRKSIIRKEGWKTMEQNRAMQIMAQGYV